MGIYIALLRGINIGGRNKILMKDLTDLFIDLSFQNVITYIQSGNVVFNSQNNSTNDLSIIIKKGILDKFKLDIPTLVISQKELVFAATNNPFYNDKIDSTRLHVTFLNEQPNTTLLTKINEETYKTKDLFEIINKCAFINCEKKYHQSKFSNAFFEKKLNVDATTRNWRTVSKLLELTNR